MKNNKKRNLLTSKTKLLEDKLIKIPYYKCVWCLLGALGLGFILLIVGYFIGSYQDRNFDPYAELKLSQHNKHQFLVRSAEVSVKMAKRALEALKNKNLEEAISDCKIAIDIFPIDAKPYILLTKIYLMTGQEEKMFDTLTLAGRSYPDFNNIVSVIDDKNLDKLPLESPDEKVSLANFPENKKMAISFMFDDGEANVYKALPTFEKYGYKATIPVVAGFVADNSNDPFWGSWAEWKDAANRGFEIANHSMYHRDSLTLHGQDFDIAIDQAKEIIEKNTGHKITAYVFPHDSYSDEAVARALKYHEAIRTPEFLKPIYKRTVDIVIGGPHVSIDTAKRLVDIGIKRRLWLIAKCHGVTPNVSLRSFKSITPEFLESYLSYIHSKTDDVWVDTFSHVYEYLSLRVQTLVDIQNLSSDAVDFTLEGSKTAGVLTTPLTVTIKLPNGASVKKASDADGHDFRSWECGDLQACVDVDRLNDKIHVVIGS